MTYDVVVIGGGAAGLSAALTLVRARRSVLVVNGGRPRNAPAAGVHGFLTRDGMPPGELVAAGRAEVAAYGGEFLDAEAGTATRVPDGFEVTTAAGTVTGRRLVVTTGVVDELPDVPGLAERWGRDVVHCPYCHGWEIRDRPIGVLNANAMAVHQATLFRQWSDDVVLFAHDGPAIDPAAAERLAARGVRVVPGRVTAIESDGEGLSGVRLADGTVVPRRALAVATRLSARSGVLAGLGLKAVPDDSGMFDSVRTVDPSGRTEVPGVWVAGNLANPMHQVVMAAASGVTAGAMVNMDLVEEEFDRALAG